MPAEPARLSIQFLGGFGLLMNGRPVTRAPSTRQQQLLAYLILRGTDAPVSRHRVAGALWPDSTTSQALTNLRRELHHLREDWPVLEALIEAGARALAWRGDAAATIDVSEFERSVRCGLQGDRAALAEAVRLYRGELLPDCAGDWLDADRERLRECAVKALRQLVELFEQAQAFGEAIEHARRLLRIEPLDEQAWCALIRCHARLGDRAAALQLYHQCAALLKKELGVQPGAATRMTYREVLDVDEKDLLAMPPKGSHAAVYPLVGRKVEWQILQHTWQTVASARPHFVLIRGEAGIGKSRLAEEFVDWCRVQKIRTVTARCYAGAGRLAFAPLAAWLQSEALAPTLQTLDASSVREIARLRPELLAARPDVAAPDRELESWQRTRFFGALAQAFRSAAPLVLVLDDLQWADGDTLDWFDYFLRSGPGARCLFLGTARAEEEPDNPFLSRLLAQLEAHNLLTTVTLGALDPEATGHLASPGRALDEAARTRVFSETEGHPLFIVERGRMELFGPGDRPSADARGPRVESVMAARLALLSADARAVAETAAVIGRDFTFEILACASDLEEAALVPALDELWRRHVVRAQGPEGWDFTHDRIREVAYATLGPARRRLVHRRVSQALELLHAHDLDRVSAAIALHLERGGQPARAVPFLDRAAAVAMRLSAGEEAIRCLTHALSLLARQPAGRDRDERELGLRSTLAGAFNSGRGYSSVEAEENLNRVLEVYGSDRRDEIPVRWLSVAWAVQFVLGNLIRSRELAERALAQSVRDPASRCEAHHAMGGTFLGIGELAAARRHFDAALAAYDRQHPPRSALGPDLGVFAQAWNAHALWLLGDGDASMASAEDAIALARRLEHPYSQALAFAYAALLHQLRGAVDEVARYASEATALCERYQFAYYVDWAHVLLGWAIGRERPAAGRAAIERAVQGLDARRALARRPYFLSLLAETLLLEGIGDRAASILDQAIALALDRAETWWLPALYLQKSALEPSPLRDETLRRGLDLARSQNSRALERRILAASSVQPT